MPKHTEHPDTKCSDTPTIFFNARLAATAMLFCVQSWAWSSSLEIEKTCIPLSPQRNQSVKLPPGLTDDADRNELRHVQAGRAYCLQNDIWIESESIFAWTPRTRPSIAAEIVASDITLDLKGHTVYSGNITYGVAIIGPSVYKDKKHVPLPAPRRVTIRNGLIRSVEWGGVEAEGRGLQLLLSDLGDPLENVSKSGKSSEMLSQWSAEFQKLNEAKVKRDLARLPPISDYEQRDIHLEDLRIKVHTNGVSVLGAGTIIRNCVIETDAGTAIWITGPNALIEGNTIVVHGTNRLREADAPIRLLQGDGAVIRNNKIVLKGRANHRIISTFFTGAITVENNTFYGLTTNEPIAQAFLGTLQMQERDNLFEPAWKKVFESVWDR